jgi:putative membrane protein
VRQQRSLVEYVWVLIKGMMMGAADAVPGVSGGTIAFITGIYEELIYSIRQCNPAALGLLFKQGPRAFWQHINGNFLLALVAGIGISIVTLASAVLYMLSNYPEILWAFFFGLILASTWSIARHIPTWNATNSALFIAGGLIAYGITSVSPTQVEATPLMVLLSGSIAICAMILPGISGSFILLLLGMYSTVLMAVKAFDLTIIGLFGLGAVGGLLMFSHILHWLFSHYRIPTLAVMSGFLLGSLNKVWPWKYTTSYTVDRHGDQIPLVQENISPFNYTVMTGHEAYFVYALAAFAVGLVLVLWIDRDQN